MGFLFWNSLCIPLSLSNVLFLHLRVLYFQFVCWIWKFSFQFGMEEKYEPLKELGSGNFAVARLVKDRKTKELLAVKYIERGKKVKFVSIYIWLLLLECIYIYIYATVFINDLLLYVVSLLDGLKIWILGLIVWWFWWYWVLGLWFEIWIWSNLKLLWPIDSGFFWVWWTS